MIVLHVAHIALGGDGANYPPRYIHGAHGSFDEARAPQAGPDWLRTMPEIEYAGARFEEQRREQKEIISTDEHDLEIRTRSKSLFEMANCGQAADPTTQDDYSRRAASRTSGVSIRQCSIVDG
jgi:hypothetical protein